LGGDGGDGGLGGDGGSGGFLLDLRLRYSTKATTTPMTTTINTTRAIIVLVSIYVRHKVSSTNCRYVVTVVDASERQ
jgi:hypothetical protein